MSKNTEDMIERVARAIHDAGFPENLRDETWKDKRWKECAMGQARGAITAMLEPTDEMVMSCVGGDPDRSGPSPRIIREIWRTMIETVVKK